MGQSSLCFCRQYSTVFARWVAGSLVRREMGADFSAVQAQPADRQGDKQHQPGGGVGGIDPGDGHSIRIYRRDPEQTENAGTQQIDDHRAHRAAAAAYGAGEHIRQAEDYVGGDRDVKPHRTGGHHGGVLVINAQKGLAEHAGDGTQDRPRDHGTQQALFQDVLHPVIFSGADILAEEGLGRLVEGIHGHINEAVDAAGGTAAGHDHAAEGIEACKAAFGRVDTIFVDPPRKGLSPGVIAALTGSGAERVVYISCNPATLARDLALLEKEGYRAVRCRAFDLFPRTGHVETVVLMSRVKD